MTRYRRVEVGMWGDAKFRELSPPRQPCARYLWMWLLSGPRTTIFPGLIVATDAVIASDLRWPLGSPIELAVPHEPQSLEDPQTLHDVWVEIASRDMAEADWEAGVVVLPRALVDRAGRPRESAKPTSPNAFRGWAKGWGDIPECRLKCWYLTELGLFAGALDALRPGNTSYTDVYLDAFATALGRVGDASGEQSSTRPRPARDPVPVPDLSPREDRSGSGSGSGPPGPAGDRDREAPADAEERVVSPVAARPVAPVRSATSLVNVFLTRINEARRSIARARGIQAPRPVTLMDGGGDGERELAKRLSASADPAADLEHVLAVAIAEAEASSPTELRWLSWSLTAEKAWRMRLASSVAEASAKPRQPARRSVFDALDEAADELSGRRS